MKEDRYLDAYIEYKKALENGDKVGIDQFLNSDDFKKDVLVRKYHKACLNIDLKEIKACLTLLQLDYNYSIEEDKNIGVLNVLNNLYNEDISKKEVLEIMKYFSFSPELKIHFKINKKEEEIFNHLLVLGDIEVIEYAAQIYQPDWLTSLYIVCEFGATNIFEYIYKNHNMQLTTDIIEKCLEKSLCAENIPIATYLKDKNLLENINKKELYAKIYLQLCNLYDEDPVETFKYFFEQLNAVNYLDTEILEEGFCDGFDDCGSYKVKSLIYLIKDVKIQKTSHIEYICKTYDMPELLNYFSE